MAAESPEVIERRMYVDMYLNGVDDTSLTLSDLRNLGAGGSNVHRAAKSTRAEDLVPTAAVVRNGTLMYNVKDREYGAKGDGVTDDTAAIRAAITAGAGRTILIPKGTYLINTIFTPGDLGYGVGLSLSQPGTTLLLEEGAVLQAIPNNQPRYSVIQITAADCTVQGGKIQGDIATHLDLATGEWGYGIYIAGTADRTVVRDMLIDGCWGDNLIVGEGTGGTGLIVADVLIENVVSTRARRNGITVISARRCRIVNCTANTTGTLNGTAPKAGFCLEPNSGVPQDIHDLLLDGCLADGNAGSGFAFHAQARTLTGVMSNCIASNNYNGFSFTSSVDLLGIGCHAKANIGQAGFICDVLTGKVSLIGCKAKANTGLGYNISSTAEAIGCTAEDNGAAGFFSNASRMTGCIARGNNTVSSYYGQFSCEGGSGAVFDGCIADAGTNGTKPSFGFRIRAGTSDTLLVGCVATGAHVTAGFRDEATNTVVSGGVPGIMAPATSMRTRSTKVGNYTLINTDEVVVFNGVGLTATLPSAVTAGNGRMYIIKNINASALTVGATAGTIDGAATANLAQWATGRYISDGANWFAI